MNGAAGEIGDFPFAGESQAAIAAFNKWKNKVLDFAVDHPTEALVTLVGGSALIFFLVEREVNEGVNTYDDALYYISTCLSVGYANIFPQTQLGKLVAAIVMTFGPSMSAWNLEGRLVGRAAQIEAATVSQPTLDTAAVLERLDAILTEMKALNAARAVESGEGA